MRTIELLSPARDCQTGMEAIRHGADAVYIGGPSFGARAAAVNTVEDIARLCDYAHIFGARVYVAVNTLLTDSELADAERLAYSLYRAGADALIVQDLAFLQLSLPPIPLHASTQMDNRTPEKVRLLADLGFKQVVLARELSLDDIGRIHSSTPVALEAFVHGALCVSYSGRCHASCHAFGRSANRGCCAQFCRLPFSLEDGDGHTLMTDRHLLSLRDMNRSEDLEDMMDAGISSFKIEGRLKGMDYVKNITAYYRQRIDEVLSRRGADYCRSSFGRSELTFIPNPYKSFNRGFTDYFLRGDRSPMHAFFSPKATGEEVGRIRRVDRRTHTLTVDLHPGITLTAGDGLCFIDSEGRLNGFRANRVEGNIVSPATSVSPGSAVTLYRNHDQLFTQTLAKSSAIRRIDLDIRLEETPNGYAIRLTDECGRMVSCSFTASHETAQTPQEENIRRQLGRLGDTPFRLRRTDIVFASPRFIRSSILAEWRRTAINRLLSIAVPHPDDVPTERGSLPGITATDPRLYAFNVANSRARDVCRALGALSPQPAFEVSPSVSTPLMTCRYCLRHALGHCLREKKDAYAASSFYLRLTDGRRFRLDFDCRRCEMQVFADR